MTAALRRRLIRLRNMIPPIVRALFGMALCLAGIQAVVMLALVALGLAK